MNVVDGKKIADEICLDLKHKISLLPFTPKISVISTSSDSLRFVSSKKKFAEKIGVRFDVLEISDATTETLVSEIEKLNADASVHGIVVQLPVPMGVDTDKVLSAIHPLKDPDALSLRPEVIAPVAGAVAEIFKRYNIDVKDKQSVVVGYGRLVGKPVAEWLVNSGAKIHIVDVATKDPKDTLINADIVVSGAGVPGLITPEKIKEGVVLVDAGTSESLGKIAGDVAPECAEKSMLFTPVPGGVGPVTVAKLFENLFSLCSRFAV